MMLVTSSIVFLDRLYAFQRLLSEVSLCDVAYCSRICMYFV